MRSRRRSRTSTSTDAPVTDTSSPDVEEVSVSFSGRMDARQSLLRGRMGEFTGLIGSNGVGKTTLLRVILGLQQPGCGDVRVLGAPLGKRSRSLGYVPQKVVLDPDIPLRARDLVALGLDGHRFGFAPIEGPAAQLVDEMFHDVDAERFADAASAASREANSNGS